MIICLFACEKKHYNEWITKNGKQYYYDEKGIMLKNCYSKIGSDTYVFNEEGAVIKDRIVNLDGKTSFVDSNGKLRYHGWNLSNGKWYYVDKSVLQTGWIKDEGNWYYLDPNNYYMLKNQWIQDKYFVDEAGHMLINTQKEIDGEQYIFDGNGVGKKIPDYQLVVECPSTLTAGDGRIKINKLDLDLNNLSSGWNTINYECDATVLEAWYRYSIPTSIELYYQVYDSDNYLVFDSHEKLVSLNNNSNKKIKVKGEMSVKLGENKGTYKLVIYSKKNPY